MGGIFMLVFWAIVILGVVFLVRGLSSRGGSAGGTGGGAETPLEILKRRYANGEIDTTEYEERRKTLMQ